MVSVDANKLAHEIHRRRLAIDSNARRCAAAGEAKFCEMYDYLPSWDDFDVYMDMNIPIGDKVLSIVSSPTPNFELTMNSTHLVDIFVFTVGEKLSETRVCGWLPDTKVLEAPTGFNASLITVNAQCVYPMPSIDFDDPSCFVEPVIDVPTLWDYDLQALWTPLGFHVYDTSARERVAAADQELETAS